MVKTQERPTPKKHSSGSNSSPSAQIVASPRPVKKRTSSPRLKDSLSAQSSMTSQTMSSRTESTYSISQSSPRSQEGRPKVVVHLGEMDDQSSSNSRKGKEIKKHKPGASKGSSTTAKKGVPTTSGSPKTSKHKRTSLNSPTSSMSGSPKSSKHKGASLNSSVSSTLASSRSSMMGDASLEQRDSVAACPRRRSSGQDQEQELVHVKDHYDYDDDTTDHSEEDKLSPLVDPVSIRLQKMDDKAKAAAPSSLQSVGTSSFSASYGSISLGGDASLSSADTFNNSPTGGKPSVDPALLVPRKPNLQAQPQKTILKPNPHPNPISWNRQRFNADQARDNHNKIETASASSASVTSESTSKWEESLQFERPPAKPLGRTSMSVSSGDCSIATFSEDASSDSWYKSQSSSLNQEDSQRVKGRKPQDKSARSRNSLASSTMEDSGNHGRMDAMFSVTTMGEDQSTEVCKMPIRSYASWTSSDDLTPPNKQSQKQWPSSGQFTWKQGSISIADWTSGDDSSSSSEDEEEKEQNRKVDNKKNAKPRSAFDKDAPWYCGSDEDSLHDSIVDSNSMHSDSSSVLSAFKKKKTTTTQKTKVAKNTAPSFESSMSFTDLVQPESMTLKDVEKASKSGKERSKQQDDSMSIGGLLDKKDSTRRKRSSFLSKVDEDTIDEGIEAMMSVELSQKSAAQESGTLVIVDDQNSGDLETGSINDRSIVDNVPKSLQSRLEDLVKLLELPWVRRLVYIGLVVFLICDIILVIVLLLR